MGGCRLEEVCVVVLLLLQLGFNTAGRESEMTGSDSAEYAVAWCGRESSSGDVLQEQRLLVESKERW